MRNFSINIPKKEFLSCIYGFLLFLMMMPYFLWEIRSADQYLFLCVSVVNIYKFRKIQSISILDIISFGLLFLFIVYATTNNNFFGKTMALLLLSFPFVKDDFLLNSYKYFKLFFSTSLILSLVFYIPFLFGINFPYEIIEPLNEGKEAQYFAYPFFVLGGGEYIFPRFFGMFDEPGVVGTFAGVMLFIEKYSFKKATNIILLVAGLLSFSFYFIIISAVGFLLFMKGWKRYIFIAVAVTVWLSTKAIPEIDSLVWQRMEFRDGGLAGDNRSSVYLDAQFDSFVKSSDFLWGKMNKDNIDASSASYKELLIKYGFVFCSLFVFAFFLMAYYRIKNLKYVVLSMLLIISVLYQRPFIFLPIYFFILYIPIVVFKSYNNNVLKMKR